MSPHQVIKQLRVSHWIKNILIFAPLFFAGRLFEFSSIIISIQLFFAFSFLASVIYIINDIADKNRDSQHPVKKHRPIASGKLSVQLAAALACAFLVACVVLAWNFSASTQLLLLTYFVLNFAYSLGLKHVPVVEFFIVASLYVLRILAGGFLLGIEISSWLLLVTFFLSLFLIVGKRNSELKFLESAGSQHISTRKVLNLYNSSFLDHLMTVLIAAVILSYSLYTIESESHLLVYSTVYIIFGMFRYLYLALVQGKGEEPEKIFFQDAYLLFDIFLWFLFVGYSFYML